MTDTPLLMSPVVYNHPCSRHTSTRARRPAMEHRAHSTTLTRCFALAHKAELKARCRSGYGTMMERPSPARGPPWLATSEPALAFGSRTEPSGAERPSTRADPEGAAAFRRPVASHLFPNARFALTGPRTVTNRDARHAKLEARQLLRERSSRTLHRFDGVRGETNHKKQ